MRRYPVSLVALVGLAAIIQVGAAGLASAETYIVLYRSERVPADAARVVTAAGGTLVQQYDAIGVAIARSDSETFRQQLLLDTSIEGVAATSGFAVQSVPAAGSGNESGGAEGSQLNLPVSPISDNLFGLQWDMVQISTPAALAITGGSRDVVVGDIDTGLDFTHPDLAPNVDFANSVSCVGGVPNPSPAAWDDDNGHGTHTAGTIAAAANGIGIVGVAPNVRLAAIKAGDSNGFFFPEAVVCAFMWAGSRHLDAVNNSYFADPWLFNCRNDPEQHAIWKAEQRAIRYAMSQGVTVVGVTGNENQDLSKTNIDTISPDNGIPLTREVTNACVVIPVEIPGVIGVSANGNLLQKSFYSSYGVGVTQVVAPGGDSRFQRTPQAPNGRVLSTWPAKFFFPSPLIVQDCSVAPCATYAYLQGTSMAAPHVTGVAALAISMFGKMPPGRVQALIEQTADPQDCPPNPFNPGPPFVFQATCDGGAGYNGFYGHGQVNAWRAVTRQP